MPEVTRNLNFHSALRLKYAIRVVKTMKQYSNNKIHLNTISNGELSDPLCDSINRGIGEDGGYQ